MATGLEVVAEERQRQVKRGFTSRHDDLHADGALLTAATKILSDLDMPSGTTWPAELADHVASKYAYQPIRRLTIAAALLVAEIERRQRLQQ